MNEANAGGSGDFWPRLAAILGPNRSPSLPAGPWIPSAVLVPLLREGGELRILLTERTAHLQRHAGQIAFPGGVVDAGELDPVTTALRETEEEIGLDRSAVQVLGLLDETPTGQGFVISPVVARVQPPLCLHLNPEEIVRTLTAALSEFDRGDNVWHEMREYRGVSYRLAFYRCAQGVVWGATARIIENLRDRMVAAGLPL